MLPENIINFDETNLTADPGTQKVIGERGEKQVERVMDSSKQSTLVMFAVTGSGTMLPPYVVYKSKHHNAICEHQIVLMGPSLLTHSKKSSSHTGKTLKG